MDDLPVCICDSNHSDLCTHPGCDCIVCEADEMGLGFAMIWACACGWRGYKPQMIPNPVGHMCCPECGASGGLIAFYPWDRIPEREAKADD